MEIETLNAMNEGLYLSLLRVIEVIALTDILLAIAGFAIYLAGVAWFCFEETRHSALRRRSAGVRRPRPGQREKPSHAKAQSSQKNSSGR